MIDEALAAEIDGWRRSGKGRSLGNPSLSSNQAQPLDGTSNDYLGLSADPRIAEGAVRALRAFGASGKASRLLGGGSPETAVLEAKIADWIGVEAALLFPSGYQANVTLIPAVAARGDVIVSDELNHASLIDAMRLSGASVQIYPHGDVHAARDLLGAAGSARRRFLVTESVFSMDGDLAPLAELHRACAETETSLIVDEAHAVGVLGQEGRGGCAAAGVAPFARVITCGKALGASGGVILGSRALVDCIIHRGRGFVFSTAISPALVGALDIAVDLVRQADDARRALGDVAAKIAAAARQPAPDAAIVPVIIGDAQATSAIAKQLQLEGLDVRAVRPPTVPEGTSRLRIVCRAGFTPDDVDRLCAAVSKLTVPGDAAPPRSEAAKPLWIVGTDTDIGKTVVSAATCLALGARYWKPVQTGDDSDTATVEQLAGPCSVAPPRYHFELPASPHTAAAAEGAHVSIDELDAALEQHVTGAGSDRLVCELAGGLLVPLDDRSTQADWLAQRRGDIVLVARSSLGTLNHTLLTLEALRARRLTPCALVLVGEAHPANAATLSKHVRALFELPMLAPLNRDALTAWLRSSEFGAALPRRTPTHSAPS